MKILITGAAGFIGSSLADAFLDLDHEVVGIDNFETGRRDNVPAEMQLVERDIADGVDDVVAGLAPDLVVHCAASYKDPSAWQRDIRSNVLGTAEVVKACQSHEVGRLIYFQTALCYGNYPKQLPVSLDHPLEPQSSYAISKTAGESYIFESGLDATSFRLANIFGPRNLSGPIPTFFRRVTAGEACTVVDSRRDFVFIADLVSIVCQALEGPAGVFHVSSGTDFAIGELYDAVTAALGVETQANHVPRGADDAPTILLDPSKTIETFGWRATTPIAEGVAAAVEWYREHGVGETYTHLALKG